MKMAAALLFFFMVFAGVAWADEKPATTPAIAPMRGDRPQGQINDGRRIDNPQTTKAPVDLTRLRAERIKIDAQLVYDEAGNPATIMLLDANGNVFATLKVK